MITNNNDSIIESIQKFTNDGGIPIIIGNDWIELNKKYTKDEIKEGLAVHIINNSPNFPYRQITSSDMIEKFIDLKHSNYNKFIMKNSIDIVEKYDDYQYPYSKYGKFTIAFGHYHNDISNYFQQENRYQCSSHGFPSPLDYWNDKTLLKKMNWIFWRMENEGIDLSSIRASFRLGAYVATQFKPHVAKTIYDYSFSKINTNTKSVLDISMGWGDRLAGFYASSGKQYFGTDPNKNVFDVYQKQCIEYEMLLSGEMPIIKKFNIRSGNNIYDAFECIGSSGKKVIAYNAPAEDILHIIEKEKYDCIFTSPPYFSTELYDKGGDDWKQSWSRYPSYISWWDEFYRPVMKACYSSLTDTGMMLINIMDPYIRGNRYRTCDQMVNYIISIGGKFDGQIGMRIKQRPRNIESVDLDKHLSNTYIENIWCFSKNGIDLSMKYATLESLFGD